ncbi:cupin domain-containing protein [Geobacillus sp. 46C-IIa]|uniref:cupin domain-containing protein n=1 Tax=Geobacillus sp. 46C-IIa TaxID=1963025 RepID=UPI0035127D35
MAGAVVEDQRQQLVAGRLVVILADVPHSIKNNGEQRARFLALFPSAQRVSMFSKTMLSVGAKVL